MHSRQASSQLTVGTPDANGQAPNSVGSACYDVTPGDPATPANDADVRLAVSITDVRRRSDLADYTSELQETATMRITDLNNNIGPGGTAAAPNTLFATQGIFSP